MASKLPKATLNLKQLHAVSAGYRVAGNHYLIKIIPFPTYRRILEALLVVWQNSTPGFPTLPFLLRQEVLKLYRDIFRTIRKVPDNRTRMELKEWARADFINNKHYNDETTIKAMLHYGRKSLKDLQRSLALSES